MLIVIWLTYSPDGFEYIRLKRLPGLIIAFIVALIRIGFSAAKIRYLADRKLSWMGAFRIILTWDFASAITPSTIGGAPVATYAMTREGITLGKSGAIMLYGVLLDQLFYVVMIPILIVGGFYMAVVPDTVGIVGMGAMFLIYIGLLAYAYILAYGLLINPESLRKVMGVVFKWPILRRLRKSVLAETDNLVSFSSEISKKPPSFLIYAFVLSTLSWLARLLIPTIVVLSFLPADVLLSFLRSAAMTFAGLIMPTPGGSGGVEGLFAIFQGELMSRKVFIGVAIFMWRLFTFYLSIGFGMLVMTWYMNPANSSKRKHLNEKPSGKPITNLTGPFDGKD